MLIFLILKTIVRPKIVVQAKEVFYFTSFFNLLKGNTLICTNFAKSGFDFPVFWKKISFDIITKKKPQVSYAINQNQSLLKEQPNRKKYPFFPRSLLLRFRGLVINSRMTFGILFGRRLKREPRTFTYFGVTLRNLYDPNE